MNNPKQGFHMICHCTKQKDPSWSGLGMRGWKPVWLMKKLTNQCSCPLDWGGSLSSCYKEETGLCMQLLSDQGKVYLPVIDRICITDGWGRRSSATMPWTARQSYIVSCQSSIYYTFLYQHDNLISVNYYFYEKHEQFQCS